MRCPTCGDEYEPDVRACADCGSALGDEMPTDAPDAAGPPGDAAQTTDARLGRFDPRVAPVVVALLERRGIAHHRVDRDDEVEIAVDRAWRDDVRAELTVSWGELLRELDPDEASALAGAGGPAPGWFDAPRGGYVDRAGRLVVDADDAEEADADAGRIVGPGMLTTGAIVAFTGWMLFDSAALVIAGIGLVVVGMLTPR